MKVRITFTEQVLGSLPGNKELATDYQVGKHPDGPQGDETEVIETMEEALVKGSTIFSREEDGRPFLWNYQIKGFFKSACLAMIESEKMTKAELSKLNLSKWTYKRTVDKMIFVAGRKLYLNIVGEMSQCERPLRADTMKGERIALARSEQYDAGTNFEMEVTCLNEKLEPFIEQWLTYGALFGLGQWRSSGKGTFSWENLDEVA
ncbi:hypothetical protein KAR91_32470 [Candidatus Pacearchaeota archaeon]|nr:hypothetical protein [Candidatus Pacearchaeota archaeon]